VTEGLETATPVAPLPLCAIGLNRDSTAMTAMMLRHGHRTDCDSQHCDNCDQRRFEQFVHDGTPLGCVQIAYQIPAARVQPIVANCNALLCRAPSPQAWCKLCKYRRE
jgi:hypothetical protein